MGEYRIPDQTLRNCEYAFPTDNGLENTGEEGIKAVVSRIACANHRISTVLTYVFNKKLQSIDGQPK
eukprot:7226908-Ditylum_brightwellii.AAC.1